MIDIQDLTLAFAAFALGFSLANLLTVLWGRRP